MKLVASRPGLRMLVGAVLTLGIALRLTQYLHNDSLWGDEAMLALSIVSRRFHELLPPLPYGQLAPVPFLWAERLIVTLFGVNELALRALPFAAGSALCVAVALVARRMVRPQEALVTLVLVAFSQTLIRYSAEAKPYGLDALIAVILAGTGAALLRRMDNPRSWWGLAAVGAVAILLSFSSVFVCLGVGLALALQMLKEKRANLLPRIGLLGLGWAALFTIAYIQLYRPAAAAPYMRSFWEGAFLIPGSPNILARTRIGVQEVLWGIDPGTALLGLGALTAGLILLGAITLWRRGQGAYALLLLTPGLAPFGASALGMYPIATRLTLFSSPLLAMLVGVGIIAAGSAVHRLVPPVQARWVAALLILPAVTCALALGVSHGRDQQMRPIVRHLTERWDSGDVVYVYHRVVPAWLFYSTNWAEPDTTRLAWVLRVSGPGGPGHENGPSRGSRSIGEGSGLGYELRGHRILLGTSSGVQGRPMFGYRPRLPDAGWADSESDRMRHNAHPRIWIVLGNASHDSVDLGKILLDAVRRDGGTLTYRYMVKDGGLYLFEF